MSLGRYRPWGQLQEKIRPEHRDRAAVVYVRQSSRQQVLEQIGHDVRLRESLRAQLRVADDHAERPAHRAVPVPQHACHRCSSALESSSSRGA